MSRDGAVWSARLAHNQEVVGSNPTPATKRLFFKTVFRKSCFYFDYLLRIKIKSPFVQGD